MAHFSDDEIIGLEFENSQKQKYKVIDVAETIRYKRHFIVRFEDTGYETRARLDNILIGNVRDKTNRTCINAREDPNEFIGFTGTTKRGGNFEVVGYAGKRNKAHMYIVRFDSGAEKAFEKKDIKKGLIKDPSICSEDIINYESTNSQGEKFKVISLAGIDKNKQKLYNVKFEETGYVGQFYKSSITVGKIKDIYYPSILGIACIGNVDSAKSEKYRSEYIIWEGIISRCYNPNHTSYKNYGAKGVTVCERWRCFEYFLEDIVKIPGYELWNSNKDLYQLDKDKKQQDVENKVYSLETCQFISIRNNVIERNIRVGNKTGYIGVDTKTGNTFKVAVNHDYYGSFTNPEAAANIYNHVARYRGYPEEYLNNVPYMSILECGNYRIYNSNKALIPMGYLLDKQRESHRYTDISDLRKMIKVININKYKNF